MELEKFDLVIDQLFEVSSKIEFSSERPPIYCVFVPVSVVFPHLVKWRLFDWEPSEDPFFALLDSPVEFAREEYVCYPVRVLAFVVLEENERSNFSWPLDF